MGHETTGDLANAAIPLVAGIYATLRGLRLIGPRRGLSPRSDEWDDRFGRVFRVFGPLLILFGLISMATAVGSRRVPPAGPPPPAQAPAAAPSPAPPAEG